MVRVGLNTRSHLSPARSGWAWWGLVRPGPAGRDPVWQRKETFMARLGLNTRSRLFPAWLGQVGLGWAA